jgi:Sugar (and other) transporter
LSSVTPDAATLLVARTLIGLALRTQMPESPRWLLKHGRYEQARAALATFGAGQVSTDQVRRAAAAIDAAEAGGTRRAWTPGVRRALIHRVGVLRFPAGHRY